MMDWPPQYQIRRSKRAKSVSIRLYSGHGLEIVLPERRKKFDPLIFLNTHREWVEKQASRLKIDLTAPKETAVLPSTIELPGISQVITVVNHPIAAANTVSCRREKNKIFFYGATHDFSLCLPLLLNHLKMLAKQHLKTMLDHFSLQCDLPYRKLSIRAQKTLWGSCSSQHDIQLNYKILFLPESLARYVLIHELCHTVHFNHSKAFWRLLSEHVSDWRAAVRLLKEADQFIPRWLLSCK